MKLQIRCLGTGLLGLLIGFSYATTADAGPSVAQKCRDAIVKNFGKAVGTADKVSTGCHKNRDSGKISQAVNCNDVANILVDTKGKLTKAKAKLGAAITKSCIEPTPPAADAVLANFVSCPEPCGTSTGVPNPMTGFDDVSACLQCLAGDIVQRRNGVMLGMPGDIHTDKDAQKCHGSIGKGYGKHLKTLLKERASCQKDENVGADLQPCDTSDTKGKIGAAALKGAAGVADACAGVINLALIDSCSSTDIASLNACLLAEDNARGSEAFAAGYELAATICPVRIDSLVRAGTGLSGTTRSHLEVGWRSYVHDADLVDQYTLSTDITCAASPPCGDCTVDGVSAAGPMYATLTRCKDNVTTRCTMPFQNDPACGGGLCTYVLGPPLPISAANNPTCNVNALSSDITGTVNPETGSAELNVNLKTQVYLGESITLPCPVCANDPIPQDGLLQGTCQGGLDGGDPCDVDGWDASFAAQADGVGLSLDCRPSTNVSGAGLIIPLQFTTGHSELAFENVCDSPLTAYACACGVCTGNTAFPCRNDGECATIGAGACTTYGGGSAAKRQPNECSDLICTALGDPTKGECASGLPTDEAKFCDGVQRADGTYYVSCDINGQADCDAFECDPSTPAVDGCGNCTATQVKSCFLDPIVVDGVPDVDNPLLVTTFCIPPTVSFAINSTGGLPGPARVLADMVVTKAY